MPRRRPEGDFTDEIKAHLQIEADRQRASGLKPEEAEAAARRAFGNVTAAQERYFEAGRFLFWDHLVQDVRFALRMLVRSPLLSVAIIATLAIGIGMSSAVFGLVHAVLLRPLPYDSPDDLVQLYETGLRGGGEADWVSFPNYRDWRDGSRAFRAMAAYRYALLTLTGAEGADSTLGIETTDQLFAVLGVSPALGRTFLPGEDAPGRERVAVISQELWERRYGADPKVVGRSVTIDGAAHTIVGVMPASFRFPLNVPGETPVRIGLWIPIRPSDDLTERGSHNFWAVARLEAGTSLAQARASMTTVAANLERQYPDTNKDLGVTVRPLDDYVAGHVRPALVLLLGAVGLVLLLTCANIANLLLSRAEARRREIAMRRALGASRGRLLRQVLTESLLLAGAGAIAGLAVAEYGTRALVRLGPPNIPRLDQTAVDVPVLLFMCVVTVCMGVLFGLAPALLGWRDTIHDTLKEAGARVSASAAGRRVRQALVAAQLALAVMLLVAAALLVRSFVRVAGLDMGFHAPRALTALVNLSPARYREPTHQAAFYEEAIRRIRDLPGVVAAAVSNSLPLTGINDQGGFAVEGRPDPPQSQEPFANRPRVSAGYFDAMGIRLVAGRLFDARDRADSLPVAIVSELAAEAYWPGTSPLGKRLATSWSDEGPVWRQIIGVVQSTRHFGLEAPQRPEIYLPHVQAPTPFMQLLVRTSGDPANLVPAIRHQIARLDPDQAVFAFQTMDELVANSEARRRFQMTLVTAFAALALVLAAIGVYGVMGHMVAQRNREIGVRLALGARPRDVVAMILRNGLWLTVAGTAAGIAGAAALARLLAGLLFGVSPLDPATYAGVVMVLMFVAGVSAYLPSRGAARVDPLVTLREDG